MTNDNMLTITIDGKEIKAPKGSMLIEVADNAGIPIPRFCYHDKLSIAASCRMCLVDVERMPKPAPACATPIMDGMIVRTRSEKAREAQKAVMEFLLINHPLDCPVCDQGGECELQDFSYQYGQNLSLFEEEKRHYEKIDIGPLVETFMNRCIQCTRCVRYGDEIAGMRELGGMNRGDRLEITTHIEHELKSEVSANIIDICPVGALTAKPSKYQARPWEYENHPSISIHDGLGANTSIHTLRGKIARSVPRENEAINEIWIADRDRFSYEAIHSSDRALAPYIKGGDGQLEKTDWAKALLATRMVLEGVISKHGADQVGVLVSPLATVEEMHLAQKLAKSLGIKNIDHRFNQEDFRNDRSEPLYRGLGVSVADVNALDSFALIGADIRMELPVLGIRMRDAVKNGARVSMLSSYDADQLVPVNALVRHPGKWVDELSAVLNALATSKNVEVDRNLLQFAGELSAEGQALVDQLLAGEKQWVVLGAEAIRHPDFAFIQALSMAIAKVSGASFGYISEGANATGAMLTKVHPDVGGLNTKAMIDAQLKAYLLVGAIDPLEDYHNPAQIDAALTKADVVVAMTPFFSDYLSRVATTVLPVAAWGETPGSLVNLEGKCQTVSAAALPQGEARPLWKVLRVLGNQFQLDGFDYINAGEILAEWNVAQKELGEATNFVEINVEGYERNVRDVLMAIPSRSLYSVDAYVRRSEALQKTPLAKRARIAVNPGVAMIASKETFELQGQSLSIRVTEKLADQVVRIPVEFAGSVPFYSADLLKEAK